MGAPIARTPCALTIAGSDSGGGAGIQADLKAFARCGVHGTSAITAITAQNTLGVSHVHPIPPETILAQVQALAADIAIDAVKVGMLADARVIAAVAQALRELPEGTPVVVDPVMVAESGAQLLDPAARVALIEQILPLASVITPNVSEALALAGKAAGEDERALLEALLRFGPGAVVLTGGHRRATDPAETIDLLIEASAPQQIVSIAGERQPGGASHGSGCTHSSVLAAQLALGQTVQQAARMARELAGEAVAKGLRDVGAGAGPVDVIGLAGMRTRR